MPASPPAPEAKGEGTVPPSRLAQSKIASEPPRQNRRKWRIPGGQKPEVTDVVLGLDFGSSYTKAAARTLYLDGGRAFLLRLGTSSEDPESYLLPSAVVFSDKGDAKLPETEDQLRRNDIKVRLIASPEDVDLQAEAACFLALAIRRAFESFEEIRSAEFPQYVARWSLNVGLPTGPWESGRINESFQKVASVGLHLARKEGPVDRNTAMEVLQAGKVEEGDVVWAVPELLAAAASYLHSPARQGGLHFLVDIGATTLDVAAVWLGFKDGESSFHILHADVHHLGVHELHRWRLELFRNLGMHDRIHGDLARPYAPPAIVPDSAIGYLKEPPSAGATKIEKRVDGGFELKVVGKVQDCVKITKDKRDPNARQWLTGVPFFLFGGGANLDFYVNAVREGYGRVKRSDSQWNPSAGKSGEYVSIGGFSKLGAAVPKDFRRADFASVSSDLFSRLSVAYGLSSDRDALGEIEPPKDIPDLERHAPRR